MEFAMQCPTCNRHLALIADPPSVRGFEFSLYACRRCQQHFMQCFCVASAISGTEVVTPEDAAIIVKNDPLQIKEFMKAWHARVIGA